MSKPKHKKAAPQKFPPGIYHVQNKEDLKSIADKFGFGTNTDAIWNHPKNKKVRGSRSEHVLSPGDPIYIPAPVKKKVPADEKKTHKVTLKRGRRLLQLVIEDHIGHPRPNEDYVLHFADGHTMAGKTDGSGRIEVEISAKIHEVQIEIAKVSWRLEIAGLNPIEIATPDGGVSGIQAILHNLGLLSRYTEGNFCEKTRSALTRFQHLFDLEEVTGVPNVKTLEKLRDAAAGKCQPNPDKMFPMPPCDPTDGFTVKETDKLPDTPKFCAKSVQGVRHKKPAKKNGKHRHVEEIEEHYTREVVHSWYRGPRYEPRECKIAAGQPNRLPIPRRKFCALCKKHSDCLDNDYNFLLAVAGMADRLKGRARNFLAIMHLETGHSYSPRIQNPSSLATGLIQFMPSTAKGLGKSVDDLRHMCRIEQLGYVQKYFEDQKRVYPDANWMEVADVVLAVFEPAGLDPANEILGVDFNRAKGPFVEGSSEKREFVHKGKSWAKSTVKGTDGKPTNKWFMLTSFGKRNDVRVSPHQLDVYCGNKGLADAEGIIRRSSYPALVNGVFTGCGKAVTEAGQALQDAGAREFQLLRFDAHLAAVEEESKLISAAEGQKVVDIAKTWAGTPYKLIGAKSEKGVGGDCSGSTWRIYQEAGYEFPYQTAASYPETDHFLELYIDVDEAQPGDVLQWPSHVAIYDPSLESKSDAYDDRMWSTHGTAKDPKKYGPSPIEWWKPAPRIFRFKKKA